MTNSKKKKYTPRHLVDLR